MEAEGGIGLAHVRGFAFGGAHGFSGGCFKGYTFDISRVRSNNVYPFEIYIIQK